MKKFKIFDRMPIIVELKEKEQSLDFMTKVIQPKVYLSELVKWMMQQYNGTIVIQKPIS